MASHVIQRTVGCAGLWATLVCMGWGQPAKSRPATARSSATITGAVLDPSDALIAGAVVTLASAGRDLSGTETDEKGEFRFNEVAPGGYELRVEYPGFKTQRARLNVGTRGASPVRMVLEIADREDSLTVDSGEGRVSVAPSENLDVVRLDPRQLASLPMLDGDVIGALTRMLDPSSTGSSGVSVIVDGLPSSERGIPLSEIEEVRINKNPYSAEFARPGRGRIEIITKSGSSKYHGSFNVAIRDFRLDARNAFAIERPPQRRRQLDGNLSGPVHEGKKNTFSLSFSRSLDNLEPIVYALGRTGPIRGNAPQDQTSSFFSAQFTRRIDKNALSFRYSAYDWSYRGQGTGGFVLPEVASDSAMRYHQLYSSYRTVLSAKLVNEFFVRVRTEDNATRSRVPGVPKLVVLDALTTGGAQANTNSTDNRIEFTDIVSWSRGRHFVKTGINVPAFGRVAISDHSNTEGTFYFSSLTDYARGKPFSFTKQAGDGRLAFWSKQTGAFVQDEIRVRRNLSVALGLRYEWQNYVHDYNNFAPRLSFAFAPGKSQKTVFRGGAGFFYDSVPADAIADLLRFDGNHLRQILLLDPSYPDPLSAANSITLLPPNIVRFSPTLRSPYTLQYSFGLERQLRKSLTLTASYVAARGVKLFRSRDVNAPLPPFYLSRPDSSLGVLRQIESSGGLKSSGMDIGLRGDLSRFFTGMIIYEPRRAMNDTDGIGSFPSNNWDLRGEWSRASFDTRHFVYLYGTLSVGKLFKFGLIFSANSGRPYSMTIGRDDNRDGVANDRPPGVPRNSLHATGAATLDMRWSRDFPLHPGRTEGMRLATSVDAFNLFNRVDYTSFVGNLSSPFFGNPVAAAPARRLQLSVGVKF